MAKMEHAGKRPEGKWLCLFARLLLFALLALLAPTARADEYDHKV
jgi:uncharacterized integral membrane protein